MNYNLKLVELKELFDIIKGNAKYTKAFCIKNKGDFPLYSADNSSVFEYVDFYDYDGEYLTLSTGGIAGVITILNGKFSVNGSRAVLIPKSKDIDINYIRYVAQPIFRSKAQGRRGVNGENEFTNLSTTVLKKIQIPLPIKDDKYDLLKQKEIAQKYSKVETHKKNLINDKRTLLQSEIDIDLTKYNYINIEVQKLFDLAQSTNGSKFTKSFIQENPGDIPVYGATKVIDEVGYGYVSDDAEIIENINGKRKTTKVKYFENCLTYNIDGSAGYIFYRKGRFSLSEKVRPLIVLDKYKEQLDLEYLKYVIEPIFRKNVRGRKGPNGENEFTKISKKIIEDLLIPIPIKDNGEFNLGVQKEIANKYKKMEEVKKSLIKQIDNVLDIDLDLI